MEYSAFSIELDCPPGEPRPGDLLPGVIAGTGLVLGDADSKLFGNWTWNIPAAQADRYREYQPLIKSRIEELYHAGLIRYGSW